MNQYCWHCSKKLQKDRNGGLHHATVVVDGNKQIVHKSCESAVRELLSHRHIFDGATIVLPDK